MAPPQAAASYKTKNGRKDGLLSLSKDLQNILWTPTTLPGSQPALILAVNTITNFQKTPPENPKVIWKLIVQSPTVSAPDVYTFNLAASVEARNESDALRDALIRLIEAVRKGTQSSPAAYGSSSSAAMAIAGAVSSSKGAPKNDNSLYDDDRLKADGKLQQNLLKQSPSLSKTFMESLRTKPESMSSSQFASQFWSSRIQLLRAYAIEQTQCRGGYNVLSTIKPRMEDTVQKVSVSQEQIQLIFRQHDVVKRAYDENVPKLSETDFWTAFFKSRLFQKLKGEKLSASNKDNSDFDNYLSYEEDMHQERRLLASHIPHIIDVEGNEEHHSQRKGNKPDVTMRPTSIDRVPIIRTLNSLSEKIMAHVTPNDIDPSQPIGMDEETFNLLALRDLQGDAEDNRIALNIRDQGSFFTGDKVDSTSAEAFLYSKQTPEEALKSVRTGLASRGSDIDLAVSIGVDEDSSDSESGEAHLSHVGSKASLRGATKRIFEAIAQQRSQNTDRSVIGLSSRQIALTCDLTPAIYDRLSLTHATTTEFLHYFWSAFLSGDLGRAEEIARLVETLDRAMDRIRAVADDAEQERLKEVAKMKLHVKEVYERTGKKLQFNSQSVKGGAKAVNQLMAPTIKAIGVAGQKFKDALAQEESLP